MTRYLVFHFSLNGDILSKIKQQIECNVEQPILLLD